MDDYTILPNIYIQGQENAVNFVVALKDLVEEYGGDIEFDTDSDIDLVMMTEDDEPGDYTLDDYLKGAIE